MRISKLSIDGFGLFDGRFELDLPEGIALIVGDNETGKSTLFSAIGAILFGLTESERGFYAPHNTASPRSGALEIESNGEYYRFSRDFASNRARVEKLGEPERILFDGSAKPSGRTDEKEAYNEWMKKLFGLESDDLFYNSVFVKQEGLPAEMEGIVRRIVSGAASADYAVVLDTLKETCETLTQAVPWKRKRKQGHIENLFEELEEKERILSQARDAAAGIDELRKQSLGIESQLMEISANIENCKSSEKDLASFSAVLAQKRQLETQLNECRRTKEDIEKLKHELARYQSMIQDEYSDYVNLPEGAEAELTSLAQVKENENTLRERYRQAEKDIPRMSLPRFTVGALIAGILVAIVGSFLPIGILKAAAILIGLAVCAWPFIYGFLDLRSQQSAREGKLQEIKAQLDLLGQQAAEIEGRYDESTRVALADALLKVREYKHMLKEKEKKEEALKHHPSLEEVDSKYHSLSNEFLLVDKELEALKARRPSLVDAEQSGSVGRAVEGTRDEILRLETQFKRLTKERDDIRYELAGAEALETISEEALEEEIAEKRSRLDQLKLSREAYLTAVAVLEESISEFQASHLSRIEEKTSEYLARITGATCRVGLNKQLEPLEIEEAAQHFSLEQLSQGIRDQLYFALRLAAIGEVCGNIHLPILLDDPFVNFDENRLKATLQMLETLSKSHQIVLLTHDRKYADWKQPACLLGTKP